jgi:hypothetical protein
MISKLSLYVIYGIWPTLLPIQEHLMNATYLLFLSKQRILDLSGSPDVNTSMMGVRKNSKKR